MPHDSIKSFVMIEQSEEVFCRTMRILICGDRDIKNKSLSLTYIFIENMLLMSPNIVALII